MSGLNAWDAAPLQGIVESVSADLKTSPNGTYSYYEARVAFTNPDADENIRDILPGMPVEAFVSSGRTRTFLDYALEPLMATFRRGLKE